MTDKEIMDMHRLIDDGIRLAQQRLWERAKREHFSLIVARGGKVVEVMPQ